MKTIYKKKALCILLALTMVLTLMPTTAFAEDTRTEVDTIKATATINVPSYGAPTNYPGFTVTEGSPARIAETMTRWQKKNTVTGKWDSVFNDNTFTEGTWRVYVQVRIDNDYGNYGKTHKLSKNPQLFVNGVKWTIDGKTMFDEISSSSLAKFYSQEYEVTSSPLPQEHNITVINGVAKNKNYIEITKAKPGDKVVLLAEDRRDKGWAFEKWVVTGATVDNEKQMNTQFIMLEGDVTAEAKYTPCDIIIKAVELTLDNYAVGKKAGDISVKIIKPDVVDFSYGDTYRCYDEDGVALGGSYVLYYLEGETVKRLGADELIKEGVEYFLEVHIKPDEGYTFLGLKEENVTLDGTAGVAMFMQPENAVYSFKPVKPSSGGAAPAPAESVQKLTIEAGEGVKVTLSTDGKTATITVDTDYELEDVVLNGTSKGKVTEVKDLKTGDKLVVTAKKKEAQLTKEELITAVKGQKLTAASKLIKTKSGKKAITITWTVKNGKGIKLDGVQIFRSVKKSSGYGKKPIFTSKGTKYTNTSVKKGKRYYYKVRGFITIDGKKYYTEYSNKTYRTVK